jgi:hypothetical protein
VTASRCANMKATFSTTVGWAIEPKGKLLPAALHAHCRVEPVRSRLGNLAELGGREAPTYGEERGAHRTVFGNVRVFPALGS